MSQDLFSALKNYASKLSNGEKTPAEIASALNHWLKESGDSIKEKIELEVSQSVSKMGFAKQSDLLKLQKEIDQLKSQKVSPVKKATAKPKAKKVVKKKAK
jgi:polyhydroxyalkanoate synthesis regulator phasin